MKKAAIAILLWLATQVIILATLQIRVAKFLITHAKRLQAAS